MTGPEPVMRRDDAGLSGVARTKTVTKNATAHVRECSRIEFKDAGLRQGPCIRLRNAGLN